MELPKDLADNYREMYSQARPDGMYDSEHAAIDDSNLEEFLEKVYTRGKKDAVIEASAIVLTHLLMDWSGEMEVYEELKRIADKIDNIVIWPQRSR